MCESLQSENSARRNIIMPDQVPPQQGSDLPVHARERLSSMRGDAKHHGLFTSDLSVNEFLLVREAGFDPVGLVIGSSIYHIGYQFVGWRQNQEVNVLSQAMYHARELAMTRMEEEADALGADGIVGVRLEVGRHEWGGELAEFIAIGTAGEQARRGLKPPPEGRPVTYGLPVP